MRRLYCVQPIHLLMKSYALTLLSFLISSFLFAQAPPEAINYSGVARDNAGLPVANSAIGLQLGILETTSSGTIIYQEDHATTTDDYGRFSVALGMGTPSTGVFSILDWGGDSHFLSVGMDVNGGTTYQLMGTTQMLSVPYALYAKSAGESNEDNDTSATNEIQSLTLSGDTLYLSGSNYVVLSDLGQSPDLPFIITNAATGITTYTAILGGEVIDLNGTVVVERGVVYDSIPSPTTVVNFGQIIIGSGQGGFNDTVGHNFQNPFLWVNTTYYARAYAITDQNDIAYGNEVTFTAGPSTNSTGSGVTDIDGNNYSTVIFGNGQEWMAENLRTSKYANGDLIPQITDPTSWTNANSDAFCWYDNDSNYDIPYGKLYNGHVSIDPRNACPTGWHVPDSVELRAMVEYWGGPFQAGYHLQSSDSGVWDSPGFNSSEFNLPGSGFRAIAAEFHSLHTEAYLWSREVASEFQSNGLRVSNFGSNPIGSAASIPLFTTDGISIRCIKD
jgi:uncharacterized protein (TIGR02145 family)